MNAYRKKPAIGKTNSQVSRPNSDDDPMGCVVIPLGSVVSYFVLTAIIRVTSNSGSTLDQFICYGTLGCFLIIMLLGAREFFRDSQMAAAERQQWKNACKSDELTIVNRHESGIYDDGHRYRRAPCRLELKMNSDQMALSQNQTIVSVRVDDYTFKRLQGCNTVRVYYRPESPLTFLLEDEV